MNSSAPTRGKGGRYHHGDLRTALVDVTIELIGEQGLRDFSMAEASRRLGVAVSAPYAHFANRDELLATVVVRAWQTFCASFLDEIAGLTDPTERLAAMADSYVRFAGRHGPLFEALNRVGVDKAKYPEVEAAERPFADAVTDSMESLNRRGPFPTDALYTAIEATARGHAILLLDGDFGSGDEAVERAGEGAAAATRALIEGRHSLGPRRAP